MTPGPGGCFILSPSHIADTGPAKSAKGGNGWGMSLLKYLVPNKKNQAHLPDDKEPTVRRFSVAVLVNCMHVILYRLFMTKKRKSG